MFCFEVAEPALIHFCWSYCIIHMHMKILCVCFSCSVGSVLHLSAFGVLVFINMVGFVLHLSAFGVFVFESIVGVVLHLSAFGVLVFIKNVGFLSYPLELT
jgi:hypothetical protein